MTLHESIVEYSKIYPAAMLEEFERHWSEKNAKGKEKWELQKTWETGKRLATWLSRSNGRFKKLTDNQLDLQTKQNSNVFHVQSISKHEHEKRVADYYDLYSKKSQ